MLFLNLKLITIIKPHHLIIKINNIPMNKFFISLGCLLLAATSCRYDENRNETIYSGENIHISTNGNESVQSTNTSFDTGNVINGDTRTFNNTGFNELNISSALDVHLTQGNTYSVKAVGKAEDLEKVQVTQQGDELTVGLKGGLSRTGKIELHITLPTLRDIDISGAVTMTATNDFTAASDFSADVSGASKLTMPLTANKASFDISGAGYVNISGKINKLEVDVEGGSNADMLNLTANEANIQASGASKARVNVTGSIEAEASGASSIEYSGNPTVRKSETSGASKIKSL